MRKLIVALIILAFAYLLSIPPFWVLYFDNPSTTMLITRRSQFPLIPRILHPQKWVTYNKLPKSIIKSVVASEDGRFFEHSGVDLREIYNSIKSSLKLGKAPRGASTISQQLVKNIYLSEGFNPLRKLKEVIITLLLETILPKQRIFEIYINTIEWGNDIYGISEASKYYFNQPPEKLSAHQAVFLASIIPNPLTFYNPQRNPKRVERRMQSILNRINRLPN